jgi:hypothetical protein
LHEHIAQFADSELALRRKIAVGDTIRGVITGPIGSGPARALAAGVTLDRRP